MDNMPTWEEVFTHLQFDPAEVPPYERLDLEHVDAPYRNGYPFQVLIRRPVW